MPTMDSAAMRVDFCCHILAWNGSGDSGCAGVVCFMRGGRPVAMRCQAVVTMAHEACLTMGKTPHRKLRAFFAR